MIRTVKSALKRAIYTVAPGWAGEFFAARARAHSHRLVAEWGCGPVNDSLFHRLGDRVLAGPFEGLALTPMTKSEQIGPFLLGTYESELDRAWSVLFDGRFPLIVDVGAKFGYYAIGLAKRFPEALVVAFDTDPWARRVMREMVAANRTANVEIRKGCHPRWLAGNAKEGCFVLSDCEGYEAVLFSPSVIDRLRTASLVIETHDQFAPGVTDNLRGAFANTHQVFFLGPGSKRRKPAVALAFLNADQARLATEEVRTNPSWLICLPREGPNAYLLSLAESRLPPG